MRLIAIGYARDGVLGFYKIIKDDGREIRACDYRFESSINREILFERLKQHKRDYLEDMRRLQKDGHHGTGYISPAELYRINKLQGLQRAI